MPHKISTSNNLPLLVICGPTATGKTSIALKLAEIFDGDLISADSRQVYTVMNIGTGKDIPKGAKKHLSSLIITHQTVSYYQIGQTKIWGYDLVNPDQEISIGQYSAIIRKVINKTWQNNKLPILVGGSGLYIDSIINPPQTLGIRANPTIRQQFDQKSVFQLQAELKQVGLKKWQQMNHSDRQNKRRLIRAIEIASYNYPITPLTPITTNILQIGLKINKNALANKIESRVISRVETGFNNEVKRLTSQYHLSPHAASALGYKQWIEYLANTTTQEQAIADWINGEIQYAKRQLTWFNKKKNIHWFDFEESDLADRVVSLVKTWYA